jgi:hypothetical protein
MWMTRLGVEELSDAHLTTRSWGSEGKSIMKSTTGGACRQCDVKDFCAMQILDAQWLARKRQAVQIASTAFCGQTRLQARYVAVS